MKYLKKIFESEEISLDIIKDIFQDLSDIVDIKITEECFVKSCDSAYDIGYIEDGDDVVGSGYSIHMGNKIFRPSKSDRLRLISDIFDCLDKSIRIVKSIDPSLEIHLREIDTSIVPDVYIIKEESQEEISTRRVKINVEYVVNDINNTPSKTKEIQYSQGQTNNLTTDIKIHKNRAEIYFIREVDDDFFENFVFVWYKEIDDDSKISKFSNKITIHFNDPLF